MAVQSDEITLAVRALVENAATAEGLQVTFDDDESLSGKVGFDSITFVNLVVKIEERFGIFIDDEDLVLERFDSVRRVVALVVEKMENQS